MFYHELAIYVALPLTKLPQYAIFDFSIIFLLSFTQGQERIKDATIRDMYMNMHFFDVPTFSEDQQTDAIEDVSLKIITQNR